MIVFLKSFLYIGIDGVDKRQLEVMVVGLPGEFIITT